MFKKIKESWQQFKESKPGHRFEERYHRRQEVAQGGFNLGKVFHVVAGVIVILFGVFMIPVPGPGSLIILLGVGMIAGEFLVMARFADRAEVNVRKLAQLAKSTWTRSPIGAKILVVLLILVCVSAAGYGAYVFIDGNSKR